MLMLAWAQTRRRYATGRGDRRGRDEIRQTRPHVLRALRGSRRGRAGRRGDLREPGPGPLLRQRRRQRDRAPAPHRTPGRVHPRDPRDPHDALRDRVRLVPRRVPSRGHGGSGRRPRACGPCTDGGAAVVLTSEEVARRSRRPVWVLASAAASDWMLLGDKRDLSRVPATERAAAAAYKQAGLTPTDVDVVELHDCFTIAEIVATEGLGLFEPGAGGLAAEKGMTSLGGAIPVNPSGGLKAKGHPIGATGAAQIAEIVTQLRGEAGPRQVDQARVGLTHTLGGNTATVLVSLFGRD